MTALVSIVIPNYNGRATISRCLEAAFASEYPSFEVIVVDDCSEDDSVEIIEKYPCRLIKLPRRSGASCARNTGARNSSGKILFFIDADCILKRTALKTAAQSLMKYGADTIIGGTYTPRPYDNNFYSKFQSIFINYSETKNSRRPDYIATHAMIINADTFNKSGGFPEKFMPILEDVEFSHRLKRNGCRLVINPDILVMHIFNFSLVRSLKNGFRKSMYWTAYSLKNKDILTDSGTASLELKINVFSCLLIGLSLFCGLILQQQYWLLPALLVCAGNLHVSRGLLSAFFTTGGTWFGLRASLYYTALYPLAVGLGVSGGILKHLKGADR